MAKIKILNLLFSNAAEAKINKVKIWTPQIIPRSELKKYDENMISFSNNSSNCSG
jgi:hypothetical protein